MRLEFEELTGNGTWDIVQLPPGKNPIGCKWVYKIKYNADGIVERYKARLVVRGDTQIEGIDFHEMFSHVVKMSTVKTLVVVAVKKQWPMYQLDVNKAFLHGDLDKEVFMKVPPGLLVSSSSTVPLACKLKKSLYRLRQASGLWYAKLSHDLCSRGYTHSLNDYSLFHKGSSESLVLLSIFVDDIILTGCDLAELDALKYFLHVESRFKTWVL